MSRAFHPPDTLTKEDIRTIADVRRDIWTQGFYGMATGSLSALVLHSLMSWGQQRTQLFKGIALNKNTRMASFFLGGSLGAFILATTAGKNSVHELHPIFQVGSRKKPENAELPSDEEILNDTEARQRNRVIRRDTITVSISLVRCS